VREEALRLLSLVVVVFLLIVGERSKKMRPVRRQIVNELELPV
jgi:hypothetical protein